MTGAIEKEDEEELVQELQDREINEEYKIWKKNTPFLYDLVLTHALEWPSLTVQWLPDKETVGGGKDFTAQRLLLGTHTSENEPNYLMIAKVFLPVEDTAIEARQYDENSGEAGGFGVPPHLAKLQVVQKITHQGEVNRARYNPHNASLIATKAPDANVYIFDYTKHPSEPPKDNRMLPDLILTGHHKEGYGIAWNPHHSMNGHILSGADDSLVCVWDIQGVTKNTHTIEAKAKFTAHTELVEDVAWHQHNDHVFGSVSDDGKLFIWDLNQPARDKPVLKVDAHKDCVNSLAFSPFNEHLILTASKDKTVALWDTRQTAKGPVHKLEGHQNEVFQVQWAPFNETILASCSSDRRVYIWDVSRIGNEQSPEDAADGPPELLFIHGGHTDRVSDMAWNPNQHWLIASVDDANILQIWQMASNIYEDDEEGEEGAAQAAGGQLSNDGDLE